MYSSAKSCVQTENSLTKSFPVDIGVHQGNILSPLLFNPFAAEVDFCRQRKTGSKLLVSTDVDNRMGPFSVAPAHLCKIL